MPAFVLRMMSFASLLLVASLIACSRVPAENPQRPTPANVPANSVASVETTASADLARLFGRAWRISNPTGARPAGSIYVFLSNGTLLETSCVETYRIATWTTDKDEPGVLRVVEDKRPAFTAKIGPSTGTTLLLQQALLMGTKEKRELTLTPVEGEFVCPDLPK